MKKSAKSGPSPDSPQTDDLTVMGAKEAATLYAIMERLIPTDQLGPGAGKAKVARYLERALKSHHRLHLDTYVQGLKAIDSLARKHTGRAFSELNGDVEDDLLRMVEAGGEGSHQQSLREFFDLVLQHTREGMFGDPSWGGNAGYAGWRLLDYPGPRIEWATGDQMLDVRIVPAYDADEKGNG